MPTTQPFVTHSVISQFATDRVNIVREDVTLYRAQVGRLRSRLKTYIDEHPDYGFVKSLHAGSLAKGTALKTLNDMDVAVYVEKSEAPTVESELLDWMAARLREALRPLGLNDDQFTPQSHCVTVSYRGSGLNVDVVPVLYEGDADNVGYLITKGTGARVKTSVSQHLTFLRARKSAQPWDFAQVVRLVKWWIRERKQRDPDFRFKSFMAELILAHLADGGLQMDDYTHALEHFFAYLVRSELEDRIAFDDYYSVGELAPPSGAAIEIFDPVNPLNNVAVRYADHERRAIVAAAQEALDAITEAAYVDKKGRALDLWQKVFGPTFRVSA